MKKANQNVISFGNLLSTALIAGTLDGLAAVIFLAKMNFSGVFQYISSAIMGKAAYAGGIKTVLIGLVLHYFITFSFTVFFVLVSNKISALSKNILLSGIIYGIFVWAVMNLLIVPLTQIPESPIHLEKAIINTIILIFCIGLPISYLTARSLRFQS
ncbi:DUF1440 domain-containing protein [Pedobacter sp. HDW13]|uniref:DUF1440 domain-containing protein n=1 Tax=unclassified Pedobacter TaxID=2628915 RepID=UPI000F5A2C04|nr:MULTISPECIES: DUF1440 domain-containing protein [unclassified Pedobacter]QIL39879.1 DUF1440 domain-containing protein [Pedobacter sp. HDW13]RQO79630.1 DUF1440 domain-containing protein [Pedobacter sp. KBW01]